MKFSQRMGLIPLSKEIQITDIDEDLNNGLWNIYSKCILKGLRQSGSRELNETGRSFRYFLWHNVFKLTVDNAPSDYSKLVDALSGKFFSWGNWYEVYDLIEASYNYLNKIGFIKNTSEIQELFNSVLEREFSGYRFISGQISPITNPREIGELEEAFASTNPYSALKGASIHLTTALTKLSDRTTPDYRNSIKESISAVESVVIAVTGKYKETLGKALNFLKEKTPIHSGLIQGFKSIYGYTSDDNGIRHALIDEPNCDFEDAKYMLISCSAFINYLIGKAAKRD